MSISTSAELLAAVSNWTNRADFASTGSNYGRVSEAIVMAEAEFNRILRVTDQETKNATFSITGEYVAVPSGFLGARTFYLNNSTKDVLTFMPDDTQTEYFGASSGTPKYFSVTGGQFRFGPVPDSTYSATLVYYTTLTTLSAGGSTTNWLLTNHSDLYLLGCQIALCNLTRDFEGASVLMPVYQDKLAQLKKSSAGQRWGGNSMAVRAA